MKNDLLGDWKKIKLLILLISFAYPNSHIFLGQKGCDYLGMCDYSGCDYLEALQYLIYLASYISDSKFYHIRSKKVHICTVYFYFSTMNICFVFSLYSMKYFFVHFSFKYSPKWNSRGRVPFNKAKLISEIATDSKFELVFLVGYQTKVILVINYGSVFFSAAYDRPNSYQLQITFTFYTSNMVPNIFIRKPMKTACQVIYEFNFSEIWQRKS